MKHPNYKFFGVLGSVALLVGGSASLQGASLPNSVKKLIPDAVTEGKATVFGTTMNPRQVKMMNTGFNSFYGTKI